MQVDCVVGIPKQYFVFSNILKTSIPLYNLIDVIMISVYIIGQLLKQRITRMILTKLTDDIKKEDNIIEDNDDDIRT